MVLAARGFLFSLGSRHLNPPLIIICPVVILSGLAPKLHELFGNHIQLIRRFQTSSFQSRNGTGTNNITRYSKLAGLY